MLIISCYLDLRNAIVSKIKWHEMSNEKFCVDGIATSPMARNFNFSFILPRCCHLTNYFALRHSMIFMGSNINISNYLQQICEVNCTMLLTFFPLTCLKTYHDPEVYNFVKEHKFLCGLHPFSSVNVS